MPGMDGCGACLGAMRDRARDLRLVWVGGFETLPVELCDRSAGAAASLVAGVVDETEFRRPNGILDIDRCRRNEGRWFVVGIPSRRLAW